MVKSLQDICLFKVQSSLHLIPQAGKRIPTLYKEILLKRLAHHDQLLDWYFPYVSYNLFCENLRNIDFYKCGQVTDKVFSALAKNHCKLHTVVIHGCPNVTDYGIQELTRGQNELVSLELRKLKLLGDKGLLCVSSEHLVKLDLRDCSSVTFEGVASVVKRNLSIRVLILEGIDDPTGRNATSSKTQALYQSKEKELVSIAQTLGYNLEELDSRLNQMSNAGMKALADYCPNLRRLNIHGCSRINGEALQRVSIGCTKLENLDLSYCGGLWKSPDNEVFWTLPTSLTTLSLCGVLLSDETIFVECLQRLKRLRIAKLCGVAALNDNTLERILESIGSQLTELDISGSMCTGLTDKALEAVCKYCTSLETLALSLLKGLTGDPLIPMLQDEQRALQIRELLLSVRGLEGDVLHQAAISCHNLEHLSVGGVVEPVTDDLLIDIAHNCPNLKKLGLKGCTKVTDRGVCEIVRHCPLKSLVVAGIINLTDKSIFALANSCPYLDNIYMNGCARISPPAIRYLTDCCVPRLFVEHATPNTTPDQLMAKNLDTGEFCRVDQLSFSNFRP